LNLYLKPYDLERFMIIASKFSPYRFKKTGTSCALGHAYELKYMTFYWNRIMSESVTNSCNVNLNAYISHLLYRLRLAEATR